MDVVCRGSEKYFVLMLYRLFSAAERYERQREVDVNQLIVNGYIMKGGYCWGFLFFNLPCWGVLNLCLTH